jgi:hypothetical protein
LAAAGAIQADLQQCPGIQVMAAYTWIVPRNANITLNGH